jgi:hypothetical protein
VTLELLLRNRKVVSVCHKILVLTLMLYK